MEPIPHYRLPEEIGVPADFNPYTAPEIGYAAPIVESMTPTNNTMIFKRLFGRGNEPSKKDEEPKYTDAQVSLFALQMKELVNELRVYHGSIQYSQRYGSFDDPNAKHTILKYFSNCDRCKLELDEILVEMRASGINPEDVNFGSFQADLNHIRTMLEQISKINRPS